MLVKKENRGSPLVIPTGPRREPYNWDIYLEALEVGLRRIGVDTRPGVHHQIQQWQADAMAPILDRIYDEWNVGSSEELERDTDAKPGTCKDYGKAAEWEERALLEVLGTKKKKPVSPVAARALCWIRGQLKETGALLRKVGEDQTAARPACLEKAFFLGGLHRKKGTMLDVHLTGPGEPVRPDWKSGAEEREGPSDEKGWWGSKLRSIGRRLTTALVNFTAAGKRTIWGSFREGSRGPRQKQAGQMERGGL